MTTYLRERKTFRFKNRNTWIVGRAICKYLFCHAFFPSNETILLLTINMKSNCPISLILLKYFSVKFPNHLLLAITLLQCCMNNKKQ